MGREADRRMMTRVSHDVKGVLRAAGRPAELADIANVCLNGLLAIPAKDMGLTAGDCVEIMFTLPGEGRVVEVSCTVLRVGPRGIALKFTAVDFDSLMLLKEYVSTIDGDGVKIEDEFIAFLTGEQRSGPTSANK